MKTDISLDARKFTKDLTVTVQIRNLFWVRLGMGLIKIGCWIGGFTLVDEFPMSLIQPEDGESRTVAGMPVVLDETMGRDEIQVRKQ